jgi:flavin reductase (DIM6/NTAB) family NADH-FMN oxidoreductase RutF
LTLEYDLSRLDAGLRDQFIEGMSHVACTVNVVTTDGPHGRAGLTVSSMCSVSADPPSLLVCVNHSSESCRIIEKNAVFCVNVLKESQIAVADVFSGRWHESSRSDKFRCARWELLATGAPALEGALVAFDCRLTSQVRHGTHMVYIGELVDIRRASSRNPLIYANRAYGTAFSHAAREKPTGIPGGRKLSGSGAFLLSVPI